MKTTQKERELLWRIIRAKGNDVSWNVNPTQMWDMLARTLCDLREALELIEFTRYEKSASFIDEEIAKFMAEEEA